VLRFEVSRSVITVQREFRVRSKKDAPHNTVFLNHARNSLCTVIIDVDTIWFHKNVSKFLIKCSNGCLSIRAQLRGVSFKNCTTADRFRSRKIISSRISCSTSSFYFKIES
jgi:hypothetical protein